MMTMAMVNGGRAAEKRRVLIVEDDALVGMGLKDQLERLGHVVIGQASTRESARALYLRGEPDVVLVDIRLNPPDAPNGAGGAKGTDGADGGDGAAVDGAPHVPDGIDLAAQLFKERRRPVVILSAYSDRELVNRAGEAGVYGYLVKPVTADALQAQIEVALRRFRDQEQLLQTLETRKLVERAKGIFMRRLNLDEPEAHKRLQQESQKRRIGLADLARIIIESEDILGGK